MTETTAFLSTFLEVALDLADAQRGIALDRDLHIQERRHWDDETIDQRYQMAVTQAAQTALERGVVVMSNNLILSPSDAPHTNKHFANLRLIAVIPVPSMGAVALDKLVSDGTIHRPTLDQLQHLAVQTVAAGSLAVSREHLLQQFRELEMD